MVCVVSPAGLPIHDATRSNHNDIARLLKVPAHVTLTASMEERFCVSALGDKYNKQGLTVFTQ